MEFKENNVKPDEIGEYISALSNGAALNGQTHGYLVWGIRDSDHAVVGTSFNPATAKASGNEDFLAWIIRLLFPQVHIAFHPFEMDGQRLVLLEVAATHTAPVRFKDFEYIRVGSYKKKLRDYPDHQRRLWRVFDQTSFEDNVAASSVSAQEVVDLIDYSSYHRLLNRPHAEQLSQILNNLASDDIIRESDTEGWDVTNFGAMLFARDIANFPPLSRKALRIVQFRGDNRINTVRETDGVHGYATGFQGAVQYLNDMLPANEIIGQALRNDGRMFPELAIRELLANALIHQDFTQTGNGPMVEVFDSRVEITSPGRPLVDPSRFIDAPPQSRNEKIASMMRRAKICEERGSGWDKVAFEVELKQLPAPLILLPGTSTRVILYGPKPFSEMDKEERLRAVYLHACLRYVEGKTLTNSSLKERFASDSVSVPTISNLIRDAVNAGLVAAVDPTTGRRYMRYQPAWVLDDTAAL
ncbi:ATP-binding protein [Amycolatopsis rubida]|uniref:ATP-binding protein n=1 Tax=Amycolatopsis rubida TaxID=112413 RepID=UPI001FCBE52D|nr:ATP-binding protein [Amycolatopsis rubida]